MLGTILDEVRTLTAEKHQTLTQWEAPLVLVVDAGKHTYFLDYQHRRSDYIRSW